CRIKAFKTSKTGVSSCCVKLLYDFGRYSFMLTLQSPFFISYAISIEVFIAKSGLSACPYSNPEIPKIGQKQQILKGF
ncbi:MAG: hypothetical protein ACOYJS_07835, partial [Acutalibacteraceae bacterium]